MPETNKSYSTALDCCRWLAAFAVVLHHVRHRILADFDMIGHDSRLLKAFYFITGLGDEAVIVFFVLSGLLVGGGALKKFIDGRYDPADYAIHRISRIYTVLLPALMIGGALDAIGLAYFNDSDLYAAYRQALADDSPNQVESRLTPLVFLGNLTMAQNWLVPIFGSNGPLWSLASEWWFYFLFWAVLGAATPRASKTSRLAYTAAALVLIAVLPRHMLLWFPIWLLGVGMAFTNRIRWRVPPWAGLVVFGIALAIVRLARSNDWLTQMDSFLRHFAFDAFIALAFCILLISLSRLRSFRLGPPGLHARLAGFSYTTYLFHFPLLMLIAAMLSDAFGIAFHQRPSPASAFYFAATVAVLLLYSYAASRLFEAHTERVRRMLSQLSSDDGGARAY